MMVPAVTEVCLPQPAHSQVHALVCSSQALFLPQAGQTKPSRPARREEVCDAGRLIREAALELDQGAGKIGHARPRERAVVRFMFYHSAATPPPQHIAVPGRRGISLYA